MSSENIKMNLPAQPVKNIEDMINWRTHIKNKQTFTQPRNRLSQPRIDEKWREGGGMKLIWFRDDSETN